MTHTNTESPDADHNGGKVPKDDLAKSTASLASAETIAPNLATPQTEDASGEMFDHYRLIKELGHGAMGTVYLAEDTKLRRHVALKRPRFASAEEAELLQRFYREAYAAATLNHPNICPVYDIGECNGIPYITMAYIEGRTLSQVIRSGKPLNPRAIVGLVRKLALALAEAHERGIVHRDLKPGNIMLNQRSEPIVMDFGLARQLDANVEDRLTSDGMLVGTLAYMSPEQVEGDLSRIGPATDVYSLGVVLFELLTGRLPFQGTAGSVIRQIATDEPAAPSSLRNGVPEELDAICLRMMAKDISNRYASMSKVARTLTEYVKSKGEPGSMAAPPPVEEVLPAQLEDQKRQIERMIEGGQWREASLQLQRMGKLKQPVAAPFVAWAREQETALHLRWQQEQEAAARMLAEAKAEFARQDYAGAAQRLVKVDKQLLTVEGQQLLDESIKLAEEVDLLTHLIEHGLSGGSQAGMFRNMQRLLQLKPKDLLVRDLYRKFRWQQRLGWFGSTLADAFSFAGAGRVRSWFDEPLLRKWFALAGVVGLISFGLMSWAIVIYLKGGDRTLSVEVDNAWLREQGGQLTLSVDGSDHTITGHGLDIKVSLGGHGFSVTNGDAVVHNPQTFVIEKEGRQVLRIDSSGMNLTAAAINEAPSPSPRTFAAQEWIDVLSLIDPDRDKTQSDSMWTGANDWQMQDGVLFFVSDGKNGKLRIPLAFDGVSLEYDIEFTVKSIPNAQDYGFSIHFPAKSGHLPTRVKMDPVASVGTILVGTLSESPLTSAPINDGQRKRLRATLVRQSDGVDRFTASIDELFLGEWSGDREAVTYKKERSPAEWVEKFLDINVWMGTNITFHAFKLRVLDGSAAMVSAHRIRLRAAQWKHHQPARLLTVRRM